MDVCRDMDAAVFEELLSFFYLGSVRLSSVERACAVLEAAERFEVKALRDATSDYLEKKLDKTNCSRILNVGDPSGSPPSFLSQISHLYSLKGLLSKAEALILGAEDLTELPDFPSLSKAAVEVRSPFLERVLVSLSGPRAQG